MSNSANQDHLAEIGSSMEDIDHQNPTQDRPQPDFMDLADIPMTKNDQILDPLPLSVIVSEIKEQIANDLNQINPGENQNPSHDQEKGPEADCFVISDEDENEVSDDGRTHSLPHTKYGPYICPNCEDVFPTSQLFAAHVSSAHYRFETTADKKRRLAAKYKNKHLQLVQSRDGLTMVPDQTSKPQRRRKKAKSAVKTKGEIQKQGEGDSGADAEEDFLVDVMVKEDFRQ